MLRYGNGKHAKVPFPKSRIPMPSDIASFCPHIPDSTAPRLRSTVCKRAQQRFCVLSSIESVDRIREFGRSTCRRLTDRHPDGESALPLPAVITVVRQHDMSAFPCSCQNTSRMEGYCRFIVFRDAILLSVSKEYAYVACFNRRVFLGAVRFPLREIQISRSRLTESDNTTFAASQNKDCMFHFRKERNPKVHYGKD